MNAMFLLCVLLLLAGAFVVSGCAQQGTGGSTAGGAGGSGGGQASNAEDQEIAQGPPLPPE